MVLLGNARSGMIQLRTVQSWRRPPFSPTTFGLPDFEDEENWLARVEREEEEEALATARLTALASQVPMFGSLPAIVYTEEVAAEHEAELAEHDESSGEER